VIPDKTMQAGKQWQMSLVHQEDSPFICYLANFASCLYEKDSQVSEPESFFETNFHCLISEFFISKNWAGDGVFPWN